MNHASGDATGSASGAPTPHYPTLLALDTATETLHLALLAGGVARTRQLEGGAKASATLVPAIQALLAEANLGWTALDAIAFGRGPGAFTGLRTAASVTQGLAFGVGKPVIALDTLLAVAEDARQAAEQAGTSLDTVWAATDARMGEVYVAAYRRVDTRWQTMVAPMLLKPDDFVAHVQDSATETLAVAGNALLAHADALAALPAHASRWPQAAPRGAALLALTQAAWLAGESIDAAQALPLYVRDKVAQTTAERAAIAAARLTASA